VAIDENYFWSWSARESRRASATPRKSFRHPIRINRSKRTVWNFQCNITKRDHPCHSNNEYLWHQMLDLTPSVKEFTSQSFVLSYTSEGVDRIYTADNDVLLNSGKRILVEVKPEWQIDDPESAQKWEDIEIAAMAIGARFLFVPDTYLLAEPRKSNVWEIHKHRHYDPPSDVVYALLRRFESYGIIPLAALAEPIRGKPYDQVWMTCFIKGLIYRRLLTFDFMHSLGATTDIHLVNRDQIYA